MAPDVEAAYERVVQRAQADKGIVGLVLNGPVAGVLSCAVDTASTTLVRKTAGVPPRGFEPLISTLKGWRPRPLDDGGAGLPEVYR